MALWGDVADITKNNASTVNNSSISKNDKKKDSKSMADEDMFLSLLVAEMQYQDPLEPTSNTDYVSELATFTQVSSLQEMNATMSNMGSQSLVGQYVTILDENGDEISGLVDFTTVKDDKTMLSINDKLYDAANVTDVINARYYEAHENASMFADLVKKLPSENDVTTNDTDAVQEALSLYNAFDNYTLQFVDEKDVQKITNLVNRLNSLLAPADNNTVGDSETSGAAEEENEEEAEETTETDIE